MGAGLVPLPENAGLGQDHDVLIRELASPGIAGWGCGTLRGCRGGRSKNEEQPGT
jgi:hypothetical protein